MFSFQMHAAPTAAPLSVSVGGIRSTSANVTWLPPPEDTHNGHIIAYMVVFGMTTSSAPLGGAEVSDALQQYTVSNLQPYTQFYVKVAAKTSAGVGPYSRNRTFNTLSDGQYSLILILHAMLIVQAFHFQFTI